MIIAGIIAASKRIATSGGGGGSNPGGGTPPPPSAPATRYVSFGITGANGGGTTGGGSTNSGTFTTTAGTTLSATVGAGGTATFLDRLNNKNIYSYGAGGATSFAGYSAAGGGPYSSSTGGSEHKGADGVVAVIWSVNSDFSTIDGEAGYSSAGTYSITIT